MGKKPKPAAYVVRKGRTPGIYSSWDDCEEQITRFPNASFQGYPTILAAQAEWDAWKVAELSKLNTGSAKALASTSHLVTNQINFKARRPAQALSLKRPASIIDLTSDDDDEPAAKRPQYFDLTGDDDAWPTHHTGRVIGRAQGGDELARVKPEDEFDLQEKPIHLTPAQMAVVDMALAGHNIFLTGAAGSGKTATLKEILRRLKARFRARGMKDEKDANCVEVVAPTGIAALPLNGRTTYSFAGWTPDSAKAPLNDILKKTSQRARKGMEKAQVVIIEEISMVENQFLQRLNILMQRVLGSNKPFGGKQMIFLGDFHQLPPVKPFANCLECGEPMSNQDIKPVCEATNCARSGKAFDLGDKWAFRAPVWKLLGLKHVKLEQIHRQKDTHFQDVLNKIRNGIHLTDEEWAALTAKKDGSFAIKLMSRRNDVTAFNNRRLNSLMSKAESWTSLDSCEKLYRSDDDVHYAAEIAKKKSDHLGILKEHRLPTILTLKVGAKVVLLSNIDQTGGLVNGSQGEVVKFVDTTSWPAKFDESMKRGRQAEQTKINEFQAKRGHLCPVVRFQNGKITTIQPVNQESLRGPSYDRYIVSRTQIPLALAWALSIHKSQGMTLGHVEVSCDAIFESGQLYVGLSRATTMEGLTVTGYSREQLEMDSDVLEFYENAPWEDLGASNVSRPLEEKSQENSEFTEVAKG